MNMDRNSILAIICCVVFFVGYQGYMSYKYPDLGKKPVALDTTKQDLPPSDNQELAKTPTPQTPSETTVVIPEQVAPQLTDADLLFESSEATFKFDQATSSLTSIKMKKYKTSPSNDSLPMELLTNPLSLQATTNISSYDRINNYNARREGQALILERREGPWSISQKFQIPESGYELPIAVSFTNTTQHSLDLSAGLLIHQNFPISEPVGIGPNSFVYHGTSIVQGVGDDRDFEDLNSLCHDEDVSDLPSFTYKKQPIQFLGFDLHYFLTVFKPESKTFNSSAFKSVLNRENKCSLSIVMYDHMGYVKPSETITIGFKAYLGPKDLSILSAHDNAFAHTINFKSLGMDLSLFAEPLLKSLQFIYGFVPNYGFAIALLTLFLKFLFYPLTKSSAISMKRMQKLQPEINKLREKFKNDPQKMQQTLMSFMSKNKANPMKGCLPILPQLPVFFSFYSVLSQAIELRHASLFGWVQDLSVADPFYILPVLLGLLMLAQQKLTPTPGMDPTQQKVMLIMPIVFTFMMLALPSGLVLYMIVNTIVSIGQQQWLNKKFENMEFKVVPA